MPKEREAQERLAAERLLKRLIDEEIEHHRKLEIERKGLEEEFLRLEADFKRKKRRGRSNSPRRRVAEFYNV